MKIEIFKGKCGVPTSVSQSTNIPSSVVKTRQHVLYIRYISISPGPSLHSFDGRPKGPGIFRDLSREALRVVPSRCRRTATFRLLTHCKESTCRQNSKAEALNASCLAIIRTPKYSAIEETHYARPCLLRIFDSRARISRHGRFSRKRPGHI